MTLPTTPSQTVGPFFAFGLCDRPQNQLLAPDDDVAVQIAGRVLDGDGVPVPDAMVEIWHAPNRPGVGWARCGTGADGEFSFVVGRPGAADGQAPHLKVLVFARGLLKPVYTRLYFPDADASRFDPVLSALSEEEASTLIARAEGDRLRFDVHLQGDGQTVFFAV